MKWGYRKRKKERKKETNGEDKKELSYIRIGERVFWIMGMMLMERKAKNNGATKIHSTMNINVHFSKQL